MTQRAPTLARAAALTIAAGWLTLLGNACTSFGSEDGAGSDAATTPDGSSGDESTHADGASAPDASDASDATTKGDAKTDAKITPPCNGATACERLVFITKNTFAGGSVGGLAGGDLKCTAAAGASTIPDVKARHFRAWLSTDAIAAKVHMTQGTKAYKRVDGIVLAANLSGMSDGNIDNPLNVDENNDPVAAAEAWTGTGAAGVSAVGLTCGNWTLPSPSIAMTGDGSMTGTGWTNNKDDVSCNASAHLYCLEE